MTVLKRDRFYSQFFLFASANKTMIYVGMRTYTRLSAFTGNGLPEEPSGTTAKSDDRPHRPSLHPRVSPSGIAGAGR